MKKKVLLLFLFVFTTSIFAQKSLIDERNGFKTIKLDSQKSTFDNLTLFQNLEGMTAYRYYPTDRDLYNVFDTNYDAIILYFDKSNSLVMIMITKVFNGNNFYQDALNNSDDTRDKFVRVFGKFDELDAEDNSGNISVTWYGKKAFFSVGTIYFGIAKGKAESNVVIGKTQSLSSGF
jgi:hypothetical protein